MALALSHLVRCQGPNEGPLPAGAQRVAIQERDRDETTGRAIQLAYHDRGTGPPLLVLHGSPVASSSMLPLANQLEKDHRVIIPDLPGFGGSTFKIADYSARGHAHAMLELLDSLEVEHAHVLGYSLGGAVALQMIEIEPTRVESLTMLSSVGVQELELLGDYTLNHAVHGLQVAAFGVLQEGFPHFGWLDRFPLNVYYARNFFDTDQRPLRALLEQLEVPTLIIHGTDDFLVPVAAAKEHHRIVPQSDLHLIPNEDHIVCIRKPEKVAPAVTRFVTTVEAGEEKNRASSDPNRVALAAESFHDHRPKQDSWKTVLFLMVLLALATFVTEDLTCIAAGLLVARGAMSFFPATLACLIGIFVGDMLLYAAGRWLGPRALRRAPLKWMIKPHQVETSTAFFRDQGAALIFGSRFLPGTRLATYFAAGMFRAPFLKFAGWFLVAAAAWTPLLVGLAIWIGGPLLGWFEQFEKYALPGLLMVFLSLWLLLRLVVPLFSYRGRRLLLSSWRRKTRWEFWPMWLFYPPIVLYILYLACKHRSLTLFTAANPAIPQGGFVLESKSAILDGFQGAAEVARYAVLSPGNEALSLMKTFMRDQGLDYPIVLKPDVGERGSGVKIAQDEAEAHRYLDAATTSIIAQAYVPGREFGVFYYRHPNEPTGRILSITDKRLIAVKGDGVQTLEHLILSDDRAVCMAKFFLDQFGPRLREVPADGEIIALTQVGTHCRGALFLDGYKHCTPKLIDAIDRLSKQFEGFHFGRYDLRVPEESDLAEGRNFTVLELNGVTSESTHIYDPKNSLFTAYRALAKQWRIAYEIGAENQCRGVKPAGIRELVQLVLKSRKHGKQEAH